MEFSVDIFKQCFINENKYDKAGASVMKAKKILGRIDGVEVVDIKTDYISGDYSIRFNYNERDLVMCGSSRLINLVIHDEKTGYSLSDCGIMPNSMRAYADIAQLMSWYDISSRKIRFNNELLW